MSRRISIRSFTINARGPNVSLNLRPWKPSDGSVNEGNFPLVKSNPPEMEISQAQYAVVTQPTGTDNNSSNSGTVTANPFGSTVD